MRFIIPMTILAAISAAQTFDIHGKLQFCPPKSIIATDQIIELLKTPEELAAYEDVVSRVAATEGHDGKLTKRCCDWMSPCCNIDSCCRSRDECYVNYCGLSNPAGGACALGE
jgi:hypothetical protein